MGTVMPMAPTSPRNQMAGRTSEHRDEGHILSWSKRSGRALPDLLSLRDAMPQPASRPTFMT
jgi:hypothetical protein